MLIARPGGGHSDRSGLAPAETRPSIAPTSFSQLRTGAAICWR